MKVQKADAVVLTDAEHGFLFTNRRAEELFSGRPGDDEPRQRAIRANVITLRSFLTRSRAGEADGAGHELNLVDPIDGSDLVLRVMSLPLDRSLYAEGAVVSVLRDATDLERRLAEPEGQDRESGSEWRGRELPEASRVKSEFMASMSHELRSPINAVLGYTQLLREEIYGTLNEKQGDALRKIQAASQHLLALINDILDLPRIESGTEPLRVESVRFEAVFAELSQTIEPLVREKELDYRVELSEDLQTIETDRTKLKQILLKVLSNAVKFTPSGRIVLKALPVDDGRSVRIEVHDTGIGIRGEDMDAIFDDFRQADQSSTRRYGGTGLGLSVTRRLVGHLGGTMKAESRFGEGSVFRVELPRVLERVE